jgi:two-component system, sensor histidine kinase and response regulator
MNNSTNGKDLPGNAFYDNLFLLIVHDLRNTFNAVINIARSVLADIGVIKPEDIRECLGIIHDTSFNMNQSLDNYITLRKIRDGLIIGKAEKTDIYAMIIIMAAGMTELYKSAYGKPVDVIFTGQKNILVDMNEVLISSVIKNLLSNAFKFSPDNGRINISAVEENGKVTISIKDEGKGMTQADIDNFKNNIPFSKPGISGEKGTGLGLILCRQIVELYGGILSVQSKAGEGCCFTVELIL